jgi:hypothetical protein
MLDDLIEAAIEPDTRFTVFRSEETDLEARFAGLGVTVDHRPLPPRGPDPFVVIEEAGAFAGAIPLAELERLLEPPLVRPGDREDVSRGYRVLFDVLDGTVFSALSRRQLLAVSREIEDRALRVGSGTLRACFQSLSTFDAQVDVYRLLAENTSLDIHVYGTPDRDPPDIPGVTYHAVGERLEPFWVVTFDGGPEAAHPCGLLAREADGEYRGFWTDDPEVVADVTAGLTAPPPSGRPAPEAPGSDTDRAPDAESDPGE